MPKISDASFNAFVDGHLTGKAERDVAAAVASDPTLGAKAAAWRRQSDALRAAFVPVAQEPLPLSLMLKVRAIQSDQAWTRPSTLVGVAFAAGTVAGFVLGWLALQIH